MKIHVMIQLLIFLLVFTISGSISAQDLTFIYTANSWGKLQECGCPGDPYGGLAERVTLIKDLRKNEKKPFILLDAGNMVSLFGDFEGKGAAVMNLMNLMKYDAAAVGPNELFNGLSGALSIRKNAEFPFTGSLIADRKNSSAPFEKFVILTCGNVRTLVLSACDSISAVLVTGPQRKSDYSFLPLEETFLEILKETAGEKIDFVIVLSQLTTENNVELLEKFPEIGIVIEAYGNKRRETPLEAGNGLIFCGGSNGQFTGKATVTKSKGKTGLKSNSLIPVLDIGQDKQAEKIIKRYFDNTK